eukprot:573561-Prymnesium_polylepis.3
MERRRVVETTQPSVERMRRWGVGGGSQCWSLLVWQLNCMGTQNGVRRGIEEAEIGNQRETVCKAMEHATGWDGCGVGERVCQKKNHASAHERHAAHFSCWEPGLPPT